jgi:hypothetical protein
MFPSGGQPLRIFFSFGAFHTLIFIAVWSVHIQGPN